ncbi:MULTISPECIES: HNH endonuclease [Xanthomonas]|uniref:HNH endonuclease n=1 Tax=Xanthomonas TaxID=338 RepID=UPI000E5BDF01|nr:HNH endonuclease [Xanthomonas sp. CPBF 426]CAG2088516.1 HNH endonuclease [Xanthomonas euroxanthea]
MSNKRLKSLRTNAFNAQSGRCYYCDWPMWLSSPSELGLRPRSARSYQCTAEHLVAQQDGGLDIPENVVAACCFCNLRRHQRPTPAPSPEVYRVQVQRRVAKGKWHSPGLRVAITKASRVITIGQPAR